MSQNRVMHESVHTMVGRGPADVKVRTADHAVVLVQTHVPYQQSRNQPYQNGRLMRELYHKIYYM